MSTALILKSLKTQYFTTILKEDYPRTPKISKELDDLEKAIRDTQVQIREGRTGPAGQSQFANPKSEI